MTAPAWRGEPAHALWHFSEDPTIARFVPRMTPTNPARGRWVWSVDSRHAPLFWFPRDCPRGTAWATAHTTLADRRRFFDQPVVAGDGDADVAPVPRIHVLEFDWLARVRECRLHAYRMPEAQFAPDAHVRGYWLAAETVEPLDVLPVGDLLARHAAAGIELRLVASIWPWWAAVIRSSLGFSGARLRNAGVRQPEWVMPTP